MSIQLIKYAGSLRGNITKQISSVLRQLQNDASWFPAAEPWLWENAVPGLLLLQPQVTWSTESHGTQKRKQRPKNKELISSPRLKKKKGERQKGETGEVLNSHFYVFFTAFDISFLHYQIFAAPGSCQQCVILKQEVLPEDLPEGERKTEGSVLQFYV